MGWALWKHSFRLFFSLLFLELRQHFWFQLALTSITAFAIGAFLWSFFIFAADFFLRGLWLRAAVFVLTLAWLWLGAWTAGSNF